MDDTIRAYNTFQVRNLNREIKKLKSDLVGLRKINKQKTELIKQLEEENGKKEHYIEFLEKQCGIVST